jgi:hypothetical protein
MISSELRRLGTEKLRADGDFRDVNVIGIRFPLEVKLYGFAEICRGLFTRFPKTGNVDAQTLSDEVRLFLVQTILYGAHT